MSQIYKASSGGGTLPPNVATSYVTNDGTSIPAGNVLNVLGGSGIETYSDPNLGDNLFIKIQNSTTNTGQTVNNQTINLSTIDCSAAGTYFFTTQISAFTTGGNGAGGQLFTTAISNGASLTVIDDTDAIAHRTSALPDINYEIVGSGTDAILQVTGQNTFTIDWGSITIYVYRG